MVSLCFCCADFLSLFLHASFFRFSFWQCVKMQREKLWVTGLWETLVLWLFRPSSAESQIIVRVARHWNPNRNNTIHTLHIAHTVIYMPGFWCDARLHANYFLCALCALQIFVFPNVCHSKTESVGKPLCPVSVDSKCLLVRFAQQRLMVSKDTKGGGRKG